MIKHLKKLSKYLDSKEIKQLISYAQEEYQVPDLENMSDSDISNFESNLSELSNSSLGKYFERAVQILKTYPEYINSNTLGLPFLKYYIDYLPKRFNEIFTDRLLIEIWNKNQKISEFLKIFFENICMSVTYNKDSTLEILTNNYPIFLETLYHDLIENYPEFYFQYKLGSIFKKDIQGNGPPEIPLEDVTKSIMKNPVLALYYKVFDIPEIQKDPEFINIEKECVQKLLNFKEPEGLVFFFNNELYEKYPFMEPAFRTKLITKYPEKIFSGISDKFYQTDYSYKLQEEVTARMIEGYNRKNIRFFFLHKLDKKFDVWGQQLAKRILEEEDYDFFYQLSLDKKYPEIKRKHDEEINA